MTMVSPMVNGVLLEPGPNPLKKEGGFPYTWRFSWKVQFCGSWQSATLTAPEVSPVIVSPPMEASIRGGQFAQEHPPFPPPPPGGMVVPSWLSRFPPSKATYLRLFQAVVPSPIFNFLVSVSSPISAGASVGLEEAQSPEVPFLICILLMRLCRILLKNYCPWHHMHPGVLSHSPWELRVMQVAYSGQRCMMARGMGPEYVLGSTHDPMVWPHADISPGLLGSPNQLPPRRLQVSRSVWSPNEFCAHRQGGDT